LLYYIHHQPEKGQGGKDYWGLTNRFPIVPATSDLPFLKNPPPTVVGGGGLLMLRLVNY
jgi:hypothetical protein